MDFQPLINDFKESESTNSPIWIWFEKDDKLAKCRICSQMLLRKDFATSCLVSHLKHHHGHLRFRQRDAALPIWTKKRRNPLKQTLHLN